MKARISFVSLKRKVFIFVWRVSLGIHIPHSFAQPPPHNFPKNSRPISTQKSTNE